ncbi:MAG: rRNA maturation RNase YbeY [Alphaproteobacteria bacterium]|nr:rRNA maturation RNase YbeY [Alphaproteobacteria bacterium]
MSDGPEIGVSAPCAAWETALPGAEDLGRRVAAAALAAGAVDGDLPVERLEVSLVLGDDALVRGLNRQYRGKDEATNVLSFAALDDEGEAIPDEGPILLGDVVIAMETTLAEAADSGRTVAAHFSHLVVHGVLHLLGFDHEDDAEAEEMESLERAVLAALGIGDPYA